MWALSTSSLVWLILQAVLSSYSKLAATYGAATGSSGGSSSSNTAAAVAAAARCLCALLDLEHR